MKKMLILVTAVLLATAAAARAEDCMECHYGGKDKKAPIISVLGNSAHAGLSCSECHPGEDFPPCPPKTPPVSCTMCHEDQVKSLGTSSHGKKMQAYIKEQTGEVKLQDICMACHGKDIHHLRPRADALSPVNRTNVYKTCLTCHDKVQPIAIDGYIDSIHGVAASGGNLRAAVCTDCHGSHFIEGMGKADSSVFYTTIPETCSKCHAKEYSEYIESKHWKTVQNGYREAPVCTSCHGEHNIRSRRDPLSPSWVGNITKTCGSCHQSEVINAKFMLPKGMVKSFLDSYHGLSGSLGDVRVANCSSCHGNHAILPSSDPRSTVNPKNLGKTCGGCHPGAEKRFIYEPIHKVANTETHWIVGWVKNIYILLIIGTIGAMLVHNSLDIFFKSTKGLPYEKEQAFDPRLTGNERIQHALLALSFICLAVSGFALSYPDSLIAQPFQWITTGADVRRWIHRGAASVFGATSLYHILYLALTARGRAQINALKPGFGDIKNSWAVMMKYLGRNPEPLTLPHYAYVEKAEYWALIWGGAVMGITGVVLLLTDVILRYMPLWVVNLADTIHFLEAVLAVSAIIVWHGYWVIFDPEYYPINLTFLFGRPRRPKKESREEEADKIEELNKAGG